MKRFIKLFLIFLFPILLLAGTMEYMLRSIPNDYAYKSKYLDTYSNKIEVLFLGNSHIFFGINPLYIKERSFNASHVSQTLKYDYAILGKYKGRWDKLQCIVVPIDYFTLYGSLEKGIENWRVKNYDIYYHIHESKSLSDNFEVVNGTFGMNLNRIRRFLKHEGSDRTCDALGWGTTYKSINSKDLTATAKVAIERHTKKAGEEANIKENIEAIQHIIAFAAASHIKVVFVTCPAYKTYFNNLNKAQLQEVIATITKLTAGKQNIQYYNLLEDASFLDTDFYDADHLNEKGAQKFSLIMNNLVDTNKVL